MASLTLLVMPMIYMVLEYLMYIYLNKVTKITVNRFCTKYCNSALKNIYYEVI